MALAASLGLAGCGGDSDDNGGFNAEEYVPKVAPIFDAIKQQFPLPNDLLFAANPVQDGTMYAGDDPTNPVIVGISKLDGASTLSHIDIKFDGSLDPGQTVDASPFEVVESSVIPNRNQNVFLIPLRYPSGDPLLNTNEVPTLAPAFDYSVLAVKATLGDTSAQEQLQKMAAMPLARASIISLDGGENNVLRISPLQPLQAKTKYLVVITRDIVDSNGNPITQPGNYALLSADDTVIDPNGSESLASLVALQQAIDGWEALAQGYFDFMDTVWGSNFSSNVNRDIALTYTFTTGGKDSILKSVAAPSTYFEEQLEMNARKDAIAKLVAGTYNLSGNNEGITDETDKSINTTLNSLLTSSSSPLYQPDLASAITAGVFTTFADVASDPAAAYLVQLAAGEAAVTVNDNDGVSIAAEAAGTANALAALLPTPKARTSNFYRRDCAGSAATGCETPLSEGLTAPAVITQGEISLPYYLQEPASEEDGTAIVYGGWKADLTLAGAMGVDLPSDKVTYRFPFPAQTAEHTVPVLAISPDANVLAASGQTKPANGWPVVMFLHGITANRSVALPFATALASACLDPDNPTQASPFGFKCFATISIDQPLHGIPPSGSFGLTSVDDPDAPVEANIAGHSPSSQLMERHFNFTADESIMPVPMDYATDFGGSGSLFSNLRDFATGGHNLAQAAVDYLNLAASLSSMDIDGDGVVPDLDVNNVYFIGHSLGAIDGVPFLATNNDAQVQAGNANLPFVKAATILNSGGFVTRLIENSANTTFGGPAVLQGLAAQGLAQDDLDTQVFFSILQGNLDMADSMNFGAKLADEGTTGVLMTEIKGGATVSVPSLDDASVFVDEVNPSDTTIPNDADADLWTATGVGPLALTLDNGFQLSALPTPLAGTEPLAGQIGAVKTADATADGNPLQVITRFDRGSHFNPVSAGTKVLDGEIFDRFSDADVFFEMVFEAAYFFSQDGTAITVANPAVVEE